MGLDLVVLAKEQHGVDINPTDVIGARRANRDDPQVMDELRRIWESGDQTATFDAFVDDVVSRDVPPIVIQYGDGFESAIPAVRAEVQYYGFRGKAIEPAGNRVSAFAERNGHDMSWLYGDLATQSDIESRIALLQRIIDEYRRENAEVTSTAEQCYQAWRRRDFAEYEKMKQSFRDDPETEQHVFEVFSFFGAIDWFRFWVDKGFTIAADY
ncbi:MAG: hypothetical protein Aurels2KO_51980 [Aureliella sp.]